MRMLKLVGVLALAFSSFVSVSAAAPVTTPCGAPIRSVVKTDIAFFNTTSESPVNLTGAVAAVDVPAGTTQCVRVRFSAIANCPFACFLRAFNNSSELNPAWTANALRFSEDQTNGGMAHSFEWAGRLAAGHHIILIKIQTGNTAGVASIGPWTFSMDVMK